MWMLLILLQSTPCPPGQLLFVSDKGELRPAMEIQVDRDNQARILRVTRPIPTECAPPMLTEQAQSLMTGPIIKTVESWQLVYLVERKSTEEVFNPQGTQILELDDHESKEQRVDEAQLPPSIRDFMAFVHPRGKFRAYRVAFRDLAQIETTWRTASGSYEVAFSVSGVPLVWESPRIHVLPDKIRRLARPRAIECAYLYSCIFESDRHQSVEVTAVGPLMAPP
ncbi:MAG: hypothetical protein KDC35_19010 [Acidobacteria bacterium]|nr:hypothetical protein [Acidobacteriota bacterium]